MDLLSYIQLYTYCYILYNRNIGLKIIRNDGIVILLVKVIYYAENLYYAEINLIKYVSIFILQR